MGKPSLVLASNSPRRRELLSLGGWSFITRPTEVDESQQPGEAPRSYVLRLAETKARICASSFKTSDTLSPTNKGILHTDENLTILAADTAVVESESILGKPKDNAEAVEMLLRLRSRTHQVYTGVAILGMSEGNLRTDLCVTDVPMRPYSEEEIDSYVATGDPLDKAGAYAIQNSKFHPVIMFSGCYASVMGLPLCHLTRTLGKFGIAPETSISAACQSSLNYTCPISAAVLSGEQVG